MKFYKITIVKCFDRKGLANILHKIYCNLSIRERLNIVDNLPFTSEDVWLEEGSIQNLLSPYCEFICEESFPFNNEDPIVTSFNEEYLNAKKWYESLPAEDQKKIDILTYGRMPQG